MRELDKRYNFADCEKKWQEYWQNNKIYKFNLEDKENVFSIDTPPPSVSGELHMGHIFGYTQMDAIARMQRMAGKNVFFPIGYDDNGLPSEKYVEKKIKRRGKSMPRQEFVEICDREIVSVEHLMYDLFISNSFSFDFDNEYRTISPQSRKISQMSFIDLYNNNHIYRKEEPVIWDVIDQTALSQADLEDKEFDSQMNYINFTLVNRFDREEENLEIMTTRPELLPACVAVFCHPDVYKQFKDSEVRTPLGVVVPMLTDESVDKEKGTGVMMCCTFGDQADVEKWKKYNLQLRNIMDEQGILRLSDFTDIDRKYKENLDGLFVEKARTKILELLEKGGKIARKPTPIKHMVKVGERSKYPIEILIKKQWLIKIIELKEELHKKVSECKWNPEYMEIRAHNWINGLSWDWCISRQRFFGVPIPIWYSRRKGEEGKVILASPEQLPVDPMTDLPKGYSLNDIEPEIDVLDTWATSSITPMLNTCAINDDLCCNDKKSDVLKLPFDLRFQGHDIITTWAFYTIVKANYHQNVVPWKNVLINGHCLSPDGTKMSKSLGNVVNPVKVIKENGSDAVRYWAINSSLGVDTSFSTDVIKNGQKLITKLFNAAKFAEIHFKNLENKTFNLKEDLSDGNIFKPVDLWLISKMRLLIDEYNKCVASFDYRKGLEITERFFWDCLCDNYLEIVKLRCYGVQGTKYQNISLSEMEKSVIKKEQDSAIKTVYYTLYALLKLFSPFIPVITEEIFYNLYEEKFSEDKSIHRRGSFADIGDFEVFEVPKQLAEEVIKILFEIRKYKSERSMSIKDIIETVEVSTKFDLNDCLEDLKNVSNVENFFIINSDNFEVVVKNEY
ncbi:MAG: valine--tRNA ligase [Rickettsiales bacterium]|jgi:valyl-tRNA synthetase|nr:valine--tRNA ligase [Rickettsiales bacterium]